MICLEIVRLPWSAEVVRCAIDATLDFEPSATRVGARGYEGTP